MKVVARSGRLQAIRAEAVFVVHDDPEAVRTMLLADVDCPWPVLVDRDRQVYRRWGLGRASFREVWLDPNVWRQYAGLLSGGERLRGRGRDVRQLGGDFVVDGTGTIVYSRPQRRDDRPPVAELLNAVEDAAGDH